MAKQNNTILYLGAAAIAFFLFKDKLMGAKTTFPGGHTVDEETEVPKEEVKNADQVIDASAPGSSISQAINTAKEIAQGFQDVKVLIKTPTGTKDIVLSKGKKKRMARKAVRTTKRSALKARKAAKHHKKAKIIIEPTESSLTPF